MRDRAISTSIATSERESTGGSGGTRYQDDNQVRSEVSTDVQG
jgi:hypothetical protein